MCKTGKYLIIISIKDPAVICYDTITGEIKYFDEMIDVFIKEIEGENVIGGFYLYQEMLYMASPVNNMMCRLNIESGDMQVFELPIESRCGCGGIMEYRDELWLLPYDGRVVVRWNPHTGEIREYTGFPQNYTCIHPGSGKECDKNPFFMPAFCEQHVYFPPYWANMYLKLNMDTGEFTQWEPPFAQDEKEIGCPFVRANESDVCGDYSVYSYTKKRIYHINLKTCEWSESEIQFDINEIKKNEAGFGKCSDKLRYACLETPFNLLESFLEGNMSGNSFDKEKQLQEYKRIIANSDGTCGKKIYEFIRRL